MSVKSEKNISKLFNEHNWVIVVSVALILALAYYAFTRTDTGSATRQINKADPINAIIRQNKATIFGVAIKDLSSGSIYKYGNKEGMVAGSVTKVMTAVYYLNQVEIGNKSLDTVMSNGETAQNTLEQLIVPSSDVAWHILDESLGYEPLQDYANSIGLASYSYKSNSLSPSDTVQLFGDLYERKLLSESNTQLLLSYMEKANNRGLIVDEASPTNTVYHKAGGYLTHLNDAAIITNTRKTIVLSIYTRSTTNKSKGKTSELIQEITRATLDAFQLN